MVNTQSRCFSHFPFPLFLYRVASGRLWLPARVYDLHNGPSEALWVSASICKEWPLSTW